MALVAQDGVDVDIDTLGRFVDTVILEPLNRIAGVSEVTSRGGAARESDRPRYGSGRRIWFIYCCRCGRNSASSAEVTAGEITEGSRRFTLRTEAISYTPESAKDLVVRTELRDGRIFM